MVMYNMSKKFSTNKTLFYFSAWKKLSHHPNGQSGIFCNFYISGLTGRDMQTWNYKSILISMLPNSDDQEYK